MTDLRNPARLLADAAQEIHVAVTLGDTLEAIAHAARDEVPGFDHVGVTVVRGDGAFTTMASTGEFVCGMDTLQYDCDQGPCLDAIRRERLVLVEHLEEQVHNWPRYVPRASEAGVRAQMGVRIHSDDSVLGSLNFYSTAARTVAPDAPRHAELFAKHAALALDQARHADEARRNIS
jgi:GAF domain-containing protein